MPRRPAPPLLAGRRRQRRAVDAGASAVRLLERQKVGRLRATLVRPATLRAYTTACIWFFGLGIDYGEDEWDIDAAIGDAIELAWDSGLSRAMIGNLICGLEHFVNPLRGKLKESWRLWKVWGQREVPARAPPLSGRATLALCWYMWVWGYPEAALLTYLGFQRFLRTMEFLGLRVNQLTFGRSKVHIGLASSKGAQRHGTTEGVTVDDSWLVGQLRQLCRQLCPGDLLLPITPRQYRALFDAAVQGLELPPTFKPYSLRRGGASQHFQRNGNMDVTMEIGRWGNVQTAKTYVNVALMDLVTIQQLETTTVGAAANAFIKHVVLGGGTTWRAAASIATR